MIRSASIYTLALLSYAFVASFSLPSVLAKEAPIKVTVYGESNYPPYSYTCNNKPAGIYTLILKEAFSLMEGYDVTIRMEPWQRILQNIDRGNYFAFFPPYYRPSRKNVTYSTPIIDEDMALYCANVETAHRKWPEDYLTLRFALNSGYLTGDEDFRRAVRSGNVSVEYSLTTLSNLLKLHAGRIDCYMNDNLSIKYVLEEMMRSGSLPKNHKIELAAFIGKEQGFLGYSQKHSNTFSSDFSQKFNAAILHMKKDGRINEIVNSYDQLQARDCLN